MTDFPIDFATLRPSKRPNQCLALPGALEAAATPDLASPVVDLEPEALKRAFCDALQHEPRLELTRTSEDGLQIEFVQRSRWLGFRDRITAGFVALEPKRSAPVLWSRSETGYYDFGVNRARVRRWLDRLADAVPPGGEEGRR